MAAAVRRRHGPPPPQGPPPLRIRPQCGGTVVTFEGDALGFSVIDANGVPVVSEKIPPHVPAGGSITVRAPDGKLVRVRVPPGVAPGATITVRI